MKTLMVVIFLIFAATFAIAQISSKPKTPPDNSVQTPRHEICGNTQDIIDEAYAKFGEVPVFGGEQPNGLIVIILRNNKEGSWTLLEVNGTSACVMGVGYRSAYF